MLALVVVAVSVVVFVVVAERGDSRFRRRQCDGGPVVDSRGSQLPRPLVPSTVQRSSGNG